MSRYSQSNGQAEATNKTLLNSLKKQLEWARGSPTVRTTVQESETNEGKLEVHQDWANEEHEVIAIRLAPYQ
ncbi:hypothetical protein CK203_114196 [Vitis vinifera]|uniref:Uncharacterized protein n=1 Tax=Vitis vinifera TaxID=29760 RepID=A0A438CP77_VITVI|nr:hypothetical protein CK203_114196 [Vitis vinifera]